MFEENENPILRLDDELGLLGLAPGSQSSPSTNSSIDAVPPEVLLDIFQAYILDCRKAYKSSSGQSGPYVWFRILHVCRHWREIALRETRFWTRVVATVHPECTEFVIAHSGVQPLSVYIPRIGSSQEQFLSSALRIMREFPRIAKMSSSLGTWLNLAESSDLAALDAPILETLSVSGQPGDGVIPTWTLQPLHKLKTLIAERLFHGPLLQNLVRPTLTTLVIRDCTCQGQLIVQLLATLPSLNRLTLEHTFRYWLDLPPVRSVSLPNLRRLRIMDELLPYFLQYVSISWNTLYLEIARGSFLTTFAPPSLILSNDDAICECINSRFYQLICDVQIPSSLDVHFTPPPTGGGAVIKVTWGAGSPTTSHEARPGFSFSMIHLLSGEHHSAKLASFLNSVPLPYTIKLSTNMVLPPALWQSISHTHLDRLEELHLSDRAARSFFLACDPPEAPPLFAALHTLQVTTGKVAVDARKNAKPYNVLRNLQRALSSRKRKGLALPFLRIIYEGVLPDEVRVALEAGGLAERLEIKGKQSAPSTQTILDATADIVSPLSEILI